jgi:hypothetical protein
MVVGGRLDLGIENEAVIRGSPATSALRDRSAF